MKTIKYDDFLRSFEIKPSDSMSFFFGAGSSMQAGIPGTSQLVWHFKRKIYCSIRKEREDKYKDLESSYNQNIIQSYFNSLGGYPKLYDPIEYSFYFEKCYQNENDRKYFIQSVVNGVNPSIGHKCLGELIISKRINRVWTTNFDELIENGIKLVNNTISIEIFSPETTHLNNDLASQYPKILKLHGDFRYDKLQNTIQETKKLNERLSNDFKKYFLEHGLIVIGYSGNDESVIDVFDSLLEKDNPFPFGLIWCIRKNDVPNAKIINIVNKANEKNGSSGFLEIDNFDELLFNLYSVCKLHNQSIEEVAQELFEKRKPFTLLNVNIKLRPIKLNTIEVKQFPKTIYSFHTDLQHWKELRELTNNKNILCSFSKGKTYSFGKLEDIISIFGGHLKSKIVLEDIPIELLIRDESFLKGLYYDLIELKLVNELKLKRSTNDRFLRKYYDEKMKITSPDKSFSIFEAFEYQLYLFNSQLWFTLLPTIHIVDHNNNLMNEYEKTNRKYEKQKLSNTILSNRRNSDYNKLLEFWLKLLKNGSNEIEFTLGDFKIILCQYFAFIGKGTSNKTKFFQEASKIDEPKLLFHHSDKHYCSIHPLKGLQKFSPFSHSFENNNSLPNKLTLAFITPKNDFSKIQKHIEKLENEISPNTEPEYLIQYNGFSNIYKRYLKYPLAANDRLCNVIDDSQINNFTILEFYNLLKSRIDYFDTIKGEFDVLIIYFPERWNKFREYKNDNTYFNIHDSLKLYCAKKNIKLQFIEDKSIHYLDQAKVRWWLSLGLYVKANSIPWLIEFNEPDTAFIGLSYAVNPYLTSNKVVIGCSQIFDSSGLGLRFLLHPIEKPVFYGKNPFMSKEDARRLILNLKEAYFNYDPNAKLKKIVIHKTTYFTSDEMEGIALALNGIENIELLQIQKYSLFRGIRGGEGLYLKFPHSFPVNRGVISKLDDYSFLLWTHGSVQNNELVGEKLNYYQSKRNIPAPLLIRRFRGNDTIDKVASDIIKLTKMNWNGGELYKYLPVTLDFSKVLSRMAKQKEYIQARPYDFRFFM